MRDTVSEVTTENLVCFLGGKVIHLNDYCVFALYASVFVLFCLFLFFPLFSVLLGCLFCLFFLSVCGAGLFFASFVILFLLVPRRGKCPSDWIPTDDTCTVLYIIHTKRLTFCSLLTRYCFSFYFVLAAKNCRRARLLAAYRMLYVVVIELTDDVHVLRYLLFLSILRWFFCLPYCESRSARFSVESMLSDTKVETLYYCSSFCYFLFRPARENNLETTRWTLYSGVLYYRSIVNRALLLRVISRKSA